VLPQNTAWHFADNCTLAVWQGCFTEETKAM